MTLLVLVALWFVLSPVLALACGAFLRAGHGPHVEAPLRLLPAPEEQRSSGDRGPRSDTSAIEDRAA